MYTEYYAGGDKRTRRQFTRTSETMSQGTNQRPWHPMRHPSLCGLRGTTGIIVIISILTVFFSMLGRGTIGDEESQLQTNQTFNVTHLKLKLVTKMRRQKRSESKVIQSTRHPSLARDTSQASITEQMIQNTQPTMLELMIQNTQLTMLRTSPIDTKVKMKGTIDGPSIPNNNKSRRRRKNPRQIYDRIKNIQTQPKNIYRTMEAYILQKNLWYQQAKFAVDEVLGLDRPSCIYCKSAMELPILHPFPFDSRSCFNHYLQCNKNRDPHETMRMWIKTGLRSMFRNGPSTDSDCPVCAANCYHKQMTGKWEGTVCGNLHPLRTLQENQITSEGTPNEFLIPEGITFECYQQTHGSQPMGNFNELGEGLCSHTWVTEPNNIVMRFLDRNGTLHERSKGTINDIRDSDGNYHIPPISSLLEADTRSIDIHIADVYWSCGNGSQLISRLPVGWTGVCANVMLIEKTKIGILPEEVGDKGNRRRRTAPDTVGKDHGVYIDSIGVPRGIPDQFKARNQITAGFESAFSWWVTINKNVDWINYLYFNQMRFLNYSKEAISGLAEQLRATSEMTFQNRIALDMVLAERGGVCVMFQESCCTFLPNNTAPDGSVTKALSEMRILAKELADNSGVDTSPFDFFTNWWSKWKSVFINIGVTLLVVVGIIVIGGCVIIPCIRELVIKSIAKGVARQMLIQPSEGIGGQYHTDSDIDWEVPDKPKGQDGPWTPVLRH